MRRAALVVLALTACQSRSEIVLGFATDLQAPDAFDTVTLNVTRVSDGAPEGGNGSQWEVTGMPGLPVNLPASFGIFSEGDDVAIDVTLTGTKGGQMIAQQRAILTIVSGQTLFYRMGLTASCIGKTDCTADETCVEGLCRAVTVDSASLPDFAATLVTELSCDSGTAYIQTDTKQPMQVDPDAGPCAASLCQQGTCFKPPSGDPSQTRTVTGESFTTFIQPSSTSTKPDDLSATTPVALIPDGSNDFTTIMGTGAADGSFEIDGVPEGEYYLQVGKTYFVTSSSSFDLSSDTLGKPNETRVTDLPNTSIALTLTGLDTWAEGDQLEWYSADEDTWGFVLQQCVAITDGVTSLSNYAVAYNSGCIVDSQVNLPPALIDKSDDFAIAQLSTQQTAEGVSYVAASRFLVPPPFTQTNGTSTAVGGQLATVPQTLTLTVDYPATQWDGAVGFDGTHATLLNPIATPTRSTGSADGTQIFVVGTPNSLVFGGPGASADFLDFQVAHGAQDTVAKNMAFATPTAPGESWGIESGIRSSWHVPFALPGTTCTSGSCDFSAGLSFAGSLGALSAGPLVPVVGPALQPTVDGTDMFTAQVGIRPNATIAWQPPSVGDPVGYSVQVWHLSATGKTTNADQTATITTTHTSVILPPGTVVPGDPIVILIIALSNFNPEAPNRSFLPISTSTIVSAMLTVGNGSGTTHTDGGIDKADSGATPDAPGGTGSGSGSGSG